MPKLEGVVNAMSGLEKMAALEKMVQELQAEMRMFKALNPTGSSGAPMDWDPVFDRIDARFEQVQNTLGEAVERLGGDVRNHQQAIEGISLPSVNVPEQTPTDLSGVSSELREVRRAIASMGERPVEAPAAESPAEWHFDVKRNQSGFIKEVKARRTSS